MNIMYYYFINITTCWWVNMRMNKQSVLYNGSFRPSRLWDAQKPRTVDAQRREGVWDVRCETGPTSWRTSGVLTGRDSRPGRLAGSMVWARHRAARRWSAGPGAMTGEAEQCWRSLDRRWVRTAQRHRCAVCVLGEETNMAALPLL